MGFSDLDIRGNSDLRTWQNAATKATKSVAKRIGPNCNGGRYISTPGCALGKLARRVGRILDQCDGIPDNSAEAIQKLFDYF